MFVRRMRLALMVIAVAGSFSLAREATEPGKRQEVLSYKPEAVYVYSGMEQKVIVPPDVSVCKVTTTYGRVLAMEKTLPQKKGQELELKFAPLREGAVLKARLNLSGKPGEKSQEKDMYIFAEDIFSEECGLLLLDNPELKVKDELREKLRSRGLRENHRGMRPQTPLRLIDLQVYPEFAADFSASVSGEEKALAGRSVVMLDHKQALQLPTEKMENIRIVRRDGFSSGRGSFSLGFDDNSKPIIAICNGKWNMPGGDTLENIRRVEVEFPDHTVVIYPAEYFYVVDRDVQSALELIRVFNAN